MAFASYVRSAFLSGIWSQQMQGRTDRPDYVAALNECLNTIVIEPGSAVRRSGTGFAQTTRGGVIGRVIKFDFQQNNPIVFELTDGHMRFFSGKTLVTTNDSVGILAISGANPAVVQTSAAVTWVTGDQAYFTGLGTTSPLLQNRVFVLTKVDTTHFSLSDSLTGATIDGSTLGFAVAGSILINRVADLTTPYVGGNWATVRAVQTEHTSFLLHASFKPYALTVLTLPTTTAFASFAIAPAIFNDGPYFDAFTNGVRATPSAKSGIINLTLDFAAWSATLAYRVGDFVTSGGNNYVSLVDQNVNSAPPSANWAATSADKAISPNGFQGSDVGRLVRLFSEPDLWSSATTYAVGNIVSYNPSGLPGQNTYWSSLTAGNINHVPGTDTTNWSLLPTQGAAIWSWGKITSLANEIDRALAGSVAIGDMTSGGGLAAAFDGNVSQNAASSAEKTFGNTFHGQTISAFGGKNFSGASDQKIQQVTYFPSIDFGICGDPVDGPHGGGPSSFDITLNLRGKASAPANAADGTLLGTTGVIGNTTSAVTVVSGDQVTAWKFVWVEVLVHLPSPGNDAIAMLIADAELKMFAPPGAATGNAVAVQIIGPPLLYTSPIRTWRLGLYSDTTGWPTCGTYSDGRLWLSSAAFPNRIDACYANGLAGGTVNFAPTDQYGQVTAAHAISYVFNADDANPIFWMTPDLQGVICGTKAGEWLVTAPTSGPITPLNIAARRTTRIGCANVEPKRTEHTTVFVQKFGRKVMEYFADVFNNKLTGPNLTWKSKHLTVTNIRELAYQQELAPIVWGRRGDGVLIGWTYKRDKLSSGVEPDIAAAHRHVLGSGRVVESITVGPSVGGNLDSLTMVTNDPATNVRHVEVMQDLAEETTALADHWLLDDAVNPTSVSSSSVTPVPYGGLTLNGLWHLNGKTVTVVVGGLDCGDFTVANGSVTVPYGDGVSAGTAGGLFTAAFAAGTSLSQIMVGFTYTSQGQIVRPHSREDTGARNGPAFGKLRRSHWYSLQVFNSIGSIDGTSAADVGIGTDFSKLDPISFRFFNGVAYTRLQPFTGIWSVPMRDADSFDSMICWQVTRPRPFNVSAIGGFLDTKDK